jgi:DNA-binding CsgD family transcriptional regulator
MRYVAAERANRVGVDRAGRQPYLGRGPAKPGYKVRGSWGQAPPVRATAWFCGGVAKSSKHDDLKNVSGVQITRGQAQILDLAARDLGVKQIAKQLGVSVPTVKTQLQRFYKANGLHSRAGAVALWVGTRRRHR